MLNDLERKKKLNFPSGRTPRTLPGRHRPSRRRRRPLLLLAPDHRPGTETPDLERRGPQPLHPRTPEEIGAAPRDPKERTPRRLQQKGLLGRILRLRDQHVRGDARGETGNAGRDREMDEGQRGEVKRGERTGVEREKTVFLHFSFFLQFRFAVAPFPSFCQVFFSLLSPRQEIRRTQSTQEREWSVWRYLFLPLFLHLLRTPCCCCSEGAATTTAPVRYGGFLSSMPYSLRASATSSTARTARRPLAARALADTGAGAAAAAAPPPPAPSPPSFVVVVAAAEAAAAAAAAAAAVPPAPPVVLAVLLRSICRASEAMLEAKRCVAIETMRILRYLCFFWSQRENEHECGKRLGDASSSPSLHFAKQARKKVLTAWGRWR